MWKKKTQADTRCLQRLYKDSHLLSQYMPAGSALADDFGRYHYQISFTDITLDISGKRKEGVSLMVDSSAQHCRSSPMCFSKTCNLMQMEGGKESAVAKLLANKCDSHMTGFSHSGSSKEDKHFKVRE